jgi:hypothetical protein
MRCPLSDIKEIKHELEIRELVARFADMVNRKATAEMYQLFTPDAELVITGLDTYTGVATIVGFLSDILDLWSGIVQAVHSGLVMLEGGSHPVQAKGRWYLSELGVKEGVDTYVGGVYSDDYVRTNDGFRFTRRRFDLLYLRSGTSATAYPFPSDLT